jgi:hypothetical protein
MGAAGTRERIIAAHEYNPHNPRKAYRPTRFHDGRQQTFKKKGDFVLNGKAVKVTQDGWY